jgi:cell division transport system ATP-binding protein
MEKNEQVVIANSLFLGYKKEEPVIKDANFTLNRGDFVFLTGHSGSGKTTLIKSLYGGIRPLKGGLEVCGINMAKAGSGKIGSLRKKLGLVFQDYKLIEEWTIKKNVMLPLIIAGYGGDICEKQTSKLLNHVKLTHKAEDFPTELSGGEQQRAAVARALVHSPQIIIADEPTGNLDDYSAEVVMDLLKTANSCQITVILATHHMPSRFDLPCKTLHIENGTVNEIS